MARLTRNSGSGADGSMVMSNRTLVCPPSGCTVYSTCWACCGAVGVPHHPVATPVVLQHLVVDQPQDLHGHLDVVRAAVGVPVHDVGVLVHRRPRRHGLDVSQRVEDVLRRGVDQDLPRCPNRHTGHSSQAVGAATEFAEKPSLPTDIVDSGGSLRG